MKRGSWAVRFKAEEGKSKPYALSNTLSLQSTCDGKHVGVLVRTMNGEEKTQKSGEDLICAAEDGETEKTLLQHDCSDKSSREINEHLHAIEAEVHIATDEEKGRAECEKQQREAKINDEAEQEIQKVYKRRDERLKQTHIDMEKRCQEIDSRRCELLRQLKDLGDNIRRCMETLKAKHHGSPSASANADTLESSVETNALLGNQPQGCSSIAKGLMCVAERVSGIARGVSFERLNGGKIGQIDGHRDRWVLEKKIKMDMVQVPVLKGSINANEVVVEDIKSSFIYVTNIKDDTTRLVIQDKTQLFNCASHDGLIIVCGTRNGQVVLYDGNWKHLRNLTLPGLSLTGAEVMCVAVDDDGSILVAPYGGNNIHVYDPSGSRRLKTIDIDDMVPIHGIHALHSGIVVHSAMFGERVCIIEKTGLPRTSAFLEESEDKCMSILGVGRMSDALFNLSCDSTRGCCVVEEVFGLTSGQVTVDKIVEFKAPRIANGLIGAGGIGILEADMIVACDGNQLLVYRKKRGVQCLRDLVK